MEERCKQCDRPIEIIAGRRKREYCSDACRQRAHRASQPPPRHQASTYTAMLAELAELRDQTKQQAERLAEMESEVSRLRYKLDVERRFLEDRDPHTFKSWLRKQSPSGFSRKVLAEPLFPPKGSRALYEAHCRRLNCTEEEHADFIRLWKLMLLRS